MKNIYLVLLISISAISCNSRYLTIPVSKISDERKQIAQNFVETYFQKCEKQDYSEFKNFNISKRFLAKTAPDTIKKNCNYLYRKYGKITVHRLVSANTAKSPKDFLDVFNFKITVEKTAEPVYLHLGMYRDQNYLEMPFSISADESYYETIRKRYYKK